MAEGAFDATIPVTRVWKDDAGEMCFEGVASSTAVDKQNERMTEKAIKKMATFKDLDLLPGHNAGPLQELGIVKETAVDNDRLRVAGTLDGTNPEAVRFFEKVAGGRPYQLSVGGAIKEAFWAFDKEAGRNIKHIDDVELEHVAVCRPGRAANPDTYLAVMAKSADAVLEGEAMSEPIALEEETRKSIAAAIVDGVKGLFHKDETPAPAEDDKPTESESQKPEEQPVMPAVTREEFEALNSKLDGIQTAINALAGAGVEPPKEEEATPEQAAEPEVEATKGDDFVESVMKRAAERVAALKIADEEKVNLLREFRTETETLSKSMSALDTAFTEHLRKEHKGASQGIESEVNKTVDTKDPLGWGNLLGRR